ncbi:DUF2971 domain-containing protein [Aeromonas caviae]|uniref:DUF2971 domain-containing protein n=1 Tax=Aeromonas caviae TaxID=648 RepID=UPI0029D41E94|nr:DUF2971 domain-containing protein [Aeromonas caviae]MDX7853478.1 DUF2971 domain-containing protein [Aeromonas caviae]
MRKLYKYYSSKLDLEEYLKNPTMRITQLSALNDPFEGFITNGVLSKLIEKVYPIISTSNKTTLRDIRKSRRFVMRQINSVGITSFSETSRNLLMWAHYASEHSGYCIGYKIPLFDANTNIKAPNSEFKKVNYDSLLFDHEHIIRLNSNNVDDDTIFSELTERILTTKSDEWAYEKEHRYITPIERCDIIRIFKTKNPWPEEIIQTISDSQIDGSHDVDDRKDYLDLISKRTDSQLTEAIHSPYSVEMKLKDFKNIMFLKKIPIESIETVYLGTKADYESVEKAYDLFDKEKSMQHINFYTYELSKERYEIYPVSIPMNKNEGRT